MLESPGRPGAAGVCGSCMHRSPLPFFDNSARVFFGSSPPRSCMPEVLGGSRCALNHTPGPRCGSFRLCSWDFPPAMVSYKNRRQLEQRHPKTVLELLLLRFQPCLGSFLLKSQSVSCPVARAGFGHVCSKVSTLIQRAHSLSGRNGFFLFGKTTITWPCLCQGHVATTCH